MGAIGYTRVRSGFMQFFLACLTQLWSLCCRVIIRGGPFAAGRGVAWGGSFDIVFCLLQPQFDVLLWKANVSRFRLDEKQPETAARPFFSARF